MVLLRDTGVPIQQRWVVVALLAGKVRILYPERCPSGKGFPMCGAQQEAAERVKIALSTDPEFRAKWFGWKFSQLPLDSVVENGQAREVRKLAEFG